LVLVRETEDSSLPKVFGPCGPTVRKLLKMTDNKVWDKHMVFIHLS
jgi:hypothetical protein